MTEKTETKETEFISLAEGILMALNRNGANIPPERQEAMKKLLIPMIEFIDEAKTPKDVAFHTTVLSRMAGLIVGYGILVSGDPRAYIQYIERMSREFEMSTLESIAMLTKMQEETEAYKKAHNLEDERSEHYKTVQRLKNKKEKEETIWKAPGVK